MNHSSQPVLKQAAAGWDSTSPTSSSANIAADLNLSPKSALAQQSQCICRSPSRVIQYSRNHVDQFPHIADEQMLLKRLKHRLRNDWRFFAKLPGQFINVVSDQKRDILGSFPE